MATDKPRSHHKRPMAENAAPEEAPLTEETLEAQMQQLTERAKEAGLNPIQMMLKAYAKQGRAIVGGFLASLEDADDSKKKA